MKQISDSTPRSVDVEQMLQHAGEASALLKAMGNERRLMILYHLLQGEKTVSELQRLIGISQSALSQHLARLRADNLVHTRRQAQNIHYSVFDGGVSEIASALERIFDRPRP